jgi:hypothetical protein
LSVIAGASEAIQPSARAERRIASGLTLPYRKRFAFVAGDDGGVDGLHNIALPGSNASANIEL